MKTMKRKEKLTKLPNRCLCGSTKGRIEIDEEENDPLYVLRCTCGLELDHSQYKNLLGRKT